MVENFILACIDTKFLISSSCIHGILVFLVNLSLRSVYFTAFILIFILKEFCYKVVDLIK